MTFAETLSRATTPEAAFAALHALSQEVQPVRLWTVMTVDMAAGLARRAYTSHPEAYPTSGTKPVPDNHWFDQVHDRRDAFVANSAEEIAAVFPDHQTIAALGCASCLNLPVTLGGALAGTVNLLDGPARFDPETVARLTRNLALPAIAAFSVAGILEGRRSA